MHRNVKEKLLNGCLAALVVLSSTLTPITVNAATTTTPTAYTRLGGADQYATAAQIAQKGWPGTTDNVVLSAGMSYTLVDALAAGPLAAKLKAPILLTDAGDSLNLYAKAELQRLKPKKVYITSGTSVIKHQVINELQAMGITPVQLGGYDQYETSVNIARELTNQGVTVSRVVLAAGWLSPADALSVAPIAAAQEMPILTTPQGKLPPSVKAYLDSIKAQITDSYIVGGSAVVSDGVKGELPGTVSRYSGLTKYDTNVQILKNFAKDYKYNQVYLANGETLVDALAGVPLAAANGAPLVLINQQLDNTAQNFLKSTLATANMVVLGGEAVVPSEGMKAMTSYILYSADNATEGSSDAAKPLGLKDNVQITGNNVTLKNANMDYSVYVKGDNVTLENLNVSGTVFIDPGEDGSATLENVTAAKIVVLSGDKESIHLNNSTADLLTVDSSSDVRVESTGTTTIASSLIRSFAVIDVKGGSLGNVSIVSTPGQQPTVELRGIFTQPVIINSEAQVHLGASAVITDLIMNRKAALLVDLGAKVTNYDNRGNAVDITGDGAKTMPSSKPIATEPATPTAPTTPTTPTTPSTPSTPSNPSTPTTPAKVTVSNLRVITDPGNSLGPYANGAEINLSKLDGTDKVIGFAVTADQDCTLQFRVYEDVQNISLKAGKEEIVTVGDLILGFQVPNGVALSDFRALYSQTKTKTLRGALLINGKSAGTLNVKLRFLE